MSIYNIGIIGKGFVGSAVAHGFSEATGYSAKIFINDKDESKSSHSLREVITSSDVIFVSVPTPSNKNGSINLDILKECLRESNKIVKEVGKCDAIFLIRSTILPGTSRKLNNEFNELKIVFNPEFLTERSAFFDFISQTRVILGGPENLVSKVKALYQDRFGKSISIIETDFESAELTKYVCNTFFATKVSFLNEMKILADKTGADWEVVREGFIRDGRVGNSHSNVPGPDGKLGFGGSCFPKDVQALINFGDEIGVDLSVIKGAWNKNLKVRPEKDWENLVGRAVVDNLDET